MTPSLRRSGSLRVIMPLVVIPLIAIGAWGWSRYNNSLQTSPTQESLLSSFADISGLEQTEEIRYGEIDEDYERKFFRAILEIVRDSVPKTWNNEKVDEKIYQRHVGGVNYDMSLSSVCPDQALHIGIGLDRLPLEEIRVQASTTFYTGAGERLQGSPPAFIWFSPISQPGDEYGSTMTFGVIEVDDSHTLSLLIRSQCSGAVAQMRDTMGRIRNRLEGRGEYLVREFVRNDFPWRSSLGDTYTNREWGYRVTIPVKFLYAYGRHTGGSPRLWMKSSEYREAPTYEPERGTIMDFLVWCLPRPDATLEDINLDMGYESSDIIPPTIEYGINREKGIAYWIMIARASEFKAQKSIVEEFKDSIEWLDGIPESCSRDE